MKILYFYHSSKDYLFKLYKNGKCPKEYFYGYFDLKEKGILVDYITSDFRLKPLFTLYKILSGLLIAFLGVNLPLHKIPTLVKKIKDYDTVICTSQESGLLTAILKRFRLINKELVVFSIGMVDKTNNSRWFHRAFLSLFVRSIDKIICFSRAEKEEIANILHFNINKIYFLPSCVDTDYFRPCETTEIGESILSVGYDKNRDWELLLKAIENLDIDLRIYTKISTFRFNPFGVNYEARNGKVVKEYREILARSKFVVLPVKENNYTAANTVLFESLAMGKAVIVSETSALRNGYNLRTDHHCILIPPGDFVELRNAILRLANDPSIVRAMGYNARKFIEENHHTSFFADKLLNILRKSSKLRNINH